MLLGHQKRNRPFHPKAIKEHLLNCAVCTLIDVVKGVEFSLLRSSHLDMMLLNTVTTKFMRRLVVVSFFVTWSRPTLVEIRGNIGRAMGRIFQRWQFLQKCHTVSLGFSVESFVWRLRHDEVVASGRLPAAYPITMCDGAFDHFSVTFGNFTRQVGFLFLFPNQLVPPSALVMFFDFMQLLHHDEAEDV
jgi:hypothetical protein